MTSRGVLRWILQQDLRPGQNLPGGGTDAGWVYALPSLELVSVGHVGNLSARAEATLQRLATRVTPVSGVRNGPAGSVSEGDPFDLIVVGRRGGATTRDVAALATRLQPEGVIYVDAPAAAGSDGMGSVEWWVTPVVGEPVTVVPSGHRHAAEHFRRQRLAAPSLSREWIGRTRRGLAHRSAAGSEPRASVEVPGRRAHTGVTGRRALVRGIGHRVVYGGASVIEQLERGLLDSVPHFRRRSHMLAPSGGPSDAPPAYVRQAAGGVEDLIGWEWSMTARAEYRTQKVVFFLFPPGAGEPALVAKVARSEEVSPRLRNAHAGLVALDRVRGRLGARVPAGASLGEHRGLAILTERAVAGVSLDRAGLTDRRVERGVQLLVDLGLATAEPVGQAAVAAALNELCVRCEASGIIGATEGTQLRTIIAEVHSVDEPVSCVLQHGDPGCWNMVLGPAGELVLLDWENAETPGMPLWDLLDFLRSCAVVRARARGTARVAEASAAPFIGEGSFASTVADALRRYRMELPMDDRYFTALFYSAWAYQALKESTRQRADAAGDGVYGRLLRTLLARRRAGGPPLGKTVEGLNG